MTRLCNASHPAIADVLCERARGHRGSHDDGSGLQEPWPRTARGRTPTAAELASAVLSDLATSLPRAEVARRHGISRARVQAIARAAGLPSGGRGGGSQPSALLARLRELAADACEDPSAYLEDAARCRGGCEAIVSRDRARTLLRIGRHAEQLARACDQHVNDRPLALRFWHELIAHEDIFRDLATCWYGRHPRGLPSSSVNGRGSWACLSSWRTEAGDDPPAHWATYWRSATGDGSG